MRTATRDDWPFIINSWLKSNRRSPLAAHLRNGVYFDQHAPMIREVLRRRGALVAHPLVAGAEDEIGGWLCCEHDGPKQLVVHFVYTHKLYRKDGVARLLLEAAGWRVGDDITATHITHVYTDWSEARVRYRITNDPYRFFRDYAAKGLGDAEAQRSSPAQ